MPNHVRTTCELTAPRSVITSWKAAHIRAVDDELMLDFETVAPMPASLEGTTCGAYVGQAFFALGVERKTALPLWCSDHTEWFAKEGIVERNEMIAWLEAHHPESLAAARQQIQVQAQTGFPDWYEWSIANWGTKWNSYRFSWLTDEPLVFEFHTAWLSIGAEY